MRMSRNATEARRLDPERLWPFHATVSRLARRSRTEAEVQGQRFRTGWVIVSARARAALASEGFLDVRDFLERHANGDSGSVGAWNPMALQPGGWAEGPMANRAARNAVAIADGLGDVVSAYPLDDSGPPMVIWTALGAEPATLVLMAGEAPAGPVWVNPSGRPSRTARAALEGSGAVRSVPPSSSRSA